MKYLSSCFQYISDDNIQEEAHVHKKTKNEKKYMSAQRMVQAETVEKMYANFVKEKSSKISKSTFFKYKPFYVEPATIREKESCLYSTCLNIHCLMQAVNVFRKSSGFEKHFSVTQFLQEDHDVDKTKFPEFFADKEVTFYQFDKVKETYIDKQNNVKEYSRTKRVDKKVAYTIHCKNDG